METVKIAVTGTDTDAGKTILSLLLMQYLLRGGKRPVYLKPFQTGCITDQDFPSDARFISENLDGFDKTRWSARVLNCFEHPKAPFFAARDMGLTVDVEKTLGAVAKEDGTCSHIIMEGAGGLYVPVTENTTMLDFLDRLRFKTVIAARAGLGTINHTLMTIESLRNRNIEPAGIVFMDGGKTPVPEEMVQENMAAVRDFSGISVSGVIGRIGDFRCPGDGCFGVISGLFSRVEC